MVAKYSPKNVCELKLAYQGSLQSRLLPEELESFFVSWSNRIPQKLLSLIITRSYSERRLNKNAENMKIINKYIKLGVVKNFYSHDDETLNDDF